SSDPPPSKSRRQHRLRNTGGTSLAPDVIVYASAATGSGEEFVRTINVLAIQRLGAAERAKIEAVDPSIRVTDAGGWFDGEYRDTWPAYTASRYLRPGSVGAGTREERDRLLADAVVVLGGWPFPFDLRARAPRLRWVYSCPA